MFFDLVPAGSRQVLDAFDAPPEQAGALRALDAVNRRFGKGTMALGGLGTRNAPPGWSMRRDSLSPSYTTDWRQLPMVRAV